MMIDPEIKFRRRVAFFISASAVFFIGLLVMLRFSYQSITTSVIETYGDTQREFAARIASQVADQFSLTGLRVRQAAWTFPQQCAENPPACEPMVKRQYGVLTADGALDLEYLDATGTMRLSAMDFFAKQGGWTPDVARAVDSVLKSRRHRAVFSKIFTYLDKDKKERPAIVVASPILVPAGEGRLKRLGAIVVPISLDAVSRRIQKGAPKSGSLETVMFGPDAMVLSHPDKEFIGGSGREIYNLTAFPNLENIITLALGGRSGVEKYMFSVEDARRRLQPNWMAFAPVRTQSDPMAIAIMYRERDIPMASAFFWRYAFTAILCLALLALINLLPLLEHREHLSTSIELKRMHDINAINEMLRNVNQELTETKRKLEARTRSAESVEDRRTSIIEQIVNTQYRLFGTIKKPSREQRELMRALKRDMQEMEHEPESRFWKKSEDEE